MPNPTHIVSLIAVAAVAVVLVLGLATMLHGKNAGRSQQLMRWRVGLQFVAIVVIMMTAFVVRR